MVKESPILLADPTIFFDNGVYYLYGTTTGETPLNGEGFLVYTSTDLKKWKGPAGAQNGLALKKGDAFGTKGFWAPQIFKEKNAYYLAYTANEQTVLAQSKSFFGPYQQQKIKPIDGTEKNIDPFIFKDDDGKHYLYHVRFDKGNYLWVAEFNLKKGAIRLETLKKCFDQTQAWEATPNYKSDPVMEGPTVLKLKGKYYLFYSANHFMNIDYAVGYAVADSPYGPWKKFEGNPIIHRANVGENGSGHGDVFTGLDGRLYYVYHIHFDDNKVGPRRTRIVPLIQKWDAKNEMYMFNVEAHKVIIPTLADTK